MHSIGKGTSLQKRHLVLIEALFSGTPVGTWLLCDRVLSDVGTTLWAAKSKGQGQVNDARAHGLMMKWVLQAQKYDLRIFMGKYLSFRAGDLQPPSFQGAHDVSQRSGWAVANAEAASAAYTETSQIQETYQDET